LINEAGWAAIVAGTTAQLIKVIAASWREARFAWPRFFDTGGMPSSHSAVVCALTTTIGMLAGARSTLFSVCFIFTLYFIAEAGGLRQDVGRQARALNVLLDEMRRRGAVDHARLKELVGHTWTEVGGGLLLGVVIGVAFALR
jgi:hypothetical protein